MYTTVRAKIIKIGNSRGVRIPRPLLEQAGLTDEVELSVQGDKLIIQSAYRVREGWAEYFAGMTDHGDDHLLDEPSTTRWDEDEWEW